MTVHDGTKGVALAQLADALAAFVDELLPGGNGWPKASVVGIQFPLVERLIEQNGEPALTALAQTLNKIGAPWAGMEPAERVEAVKSLEASDPGRFGWLRDAAFQAYYESPVIVMLIDANGTPYKIRPHLSGYDLPKFDRATQTPRHNRGHYIPTDQVKPVDTSGLNLDTVKTEKWGLQR
ncbi:hypothetical protein [Psychromarinibacter halotolerans]|uniref:Gluconate 2-dehydrogenase subunit 3-like protein n=1 Tax=Psychromarinibacter halotolerans TaxID=1775175 RepID=A0ABV7GXN4_9RHOB|nr:hypothetical protein [Psychromarinibacter halotolerans]MAQ83088.1 hypothetical protein [Maritimibacter sp.]MDF0597979.1 hypothetical protein [Psychromarinibacter halotolerans]